MVKRKPPKRPPAAGVKQLFHGVAIKSLYGRSCAAAVALDGLRFLSDEAPTLPLPNCDMPDTCKCVYEHFSDRRTTLRRDVDAGLPPAYRAVDRRQSRRRITDV